MNDACIDKIIVPIDECASGMTLMQSIVDENTGTTIVAKGQVLNDEHISRLKNFRHSQIWVHIDKQSSFWKVSKASSEAYKSYAKMLRQALNAEDESLPIDLEEFKRIAKMIVRDFNDDYELLGCVDLLKRLDKDSYYHSINVAFLALLVGRWQKYDHEKLERLVLTALLHDVGKLKIKASILGKKEKDMTLLEKLEYRRHTILGYELLASYKELDVEVLKGVLSHHECMDGSGYPLSLEGDVLNDFAKIIGIVDTFDHLKEKYHIFKAIRHLGSIRYKKFDKEILLQFCNNVVNYYIGCKVLLSTGEVGEVAFIQTKALYRPIVKVKDRKINLYDQTGIEIVSIL